MKRACLIIAILALAGFALAQNEPLTLTSPNGGEAWALGSTHDITWTSVNLAGTVNLLLTGTNSNTPQYTIVSGIPVQQGVFHWTIPSTLTTGSYYRVQISLPSPAGSMIQDISDAPFSLISNTDPPPPQTYIHVLSPNGGELWPAGSTQTIAWSYGNLEGEVRITLVQGANTPQIVIAESTPIAAGAFTWTVPNTIPTGQYKAHVQWLGIPAVYWGDVSDGFFTISNGDPPPTPALNLISPNGGETWVAGTMHPIIWEFTGNGGSVLIQLMGGPEMSPMVVIANNVPANSCIFQWHIPFYQMPGNAYQVQISLISDDGTFISDISEAPFTIVENNLPPQGITVTSPNGGETWVAGTMHPITWDFSNLDGEVYIGLIAENMNSINILVPSIPIAEQQFFWNIPADLMPGRYMIQIVWISDMTVFISDISDGFFNIVSDGPPPPSAINLLSPNGGEVWMIGQSYPIHWFSTLPDGTVNLMLVTQNDPAAFTMLIAENIPAAMQAFHWTIPDLVPCGNGYRIAATLVTPDGMAFTDISDAPFSILVGEEPPPQELCVTSPNGGEQWVKGTWHNITWENYNHVGRIRIVLVWGQQAPFRKLVIARNAPNTGTYRWRVPYRVPAGDSYRIVIRGINGTMDSSDGFFSIQAPNNSMKAAPNPTKQSTYISFELDTPSIATVSIYNIKGQCVRTLISGQTIGGKQNILWDGNDGAGRKVSAGIYFARVLTPQLNLTHRIIMLK